MPGPVLRWGHPAGPWHFKHFNAHFPKSVRQCRPMVVSLVARSPWSQGACCRCHAERNRAQAGVTERTRPVPPGTPGKGCRPRRRLPVPPETGGMPVTWAGCGCGGAWADQACGLASAWVRARSARPVPGPRPVTELRSAPGPPRPVHRVVRTARWFEVVVSEDGRSVETWNGGCPDSPGRGPRTGPGRAGPGAAYGSGRPGPAKPTPDCGRRARPGPGRVAPGRGDPEP